MSEPILIWRFEDAPAEYRRLSPHGGDEDLLALLPMGNDLGAEVDRIHWAEPSRSWHADGLVLIWAHA